MWVSPLWLSALHIGLYIGLCVYVCVFVYKGDTAGAHGKDGHCDKHLNFFFLRFLYGLPCLLFTLFEVFLPPVLIMIILKHLNKISLIFAVISLSIIKT